MNRKRIIDVLQIRQDWLERQGIIKLELVPSMAFGGSLARMGVGLAYFTATGRPLQAACKVKLEAELRNDLGLPVMLIFQPPSGQDRTAWRQELVF